MKKVLLLIVMFFSIVVFYGCGKKEEKPYNTEQKEILADDEVVLEGIKYKLDQEENEYGFKYKVASNFRKADFGNAMCYFSEKIDGNEYFVIRIFHYKNKTIDYAIKDTIPDYDIKKEVKINDLDYTFAHAKNYTGADINFYYHKHGKEIHAISFTGHIDLSRLEDIFLKQVVY